MVITDCGYLRIQREWRKEVAENALCPLVQVETDVVVPVEQACPKEAYSAAVLRPKINGQLRKYLVPLSETLVKHTLRNQDFAGLDLKKADSTSLFSFHRRAVNPVSHFRGGTSEAKGSWGISSPIN